MGDANERRTNFEAIASALADASKSLAIARELFEQGDPRFRFLDSDLREAEGFIGKAYKSVDSYIPRLYQPGHVCHGMTAAECEQKRRDDALEAFTDATPGAIYVDFRERS